MILDRQLLIKGKLKITELTVSKLWSNLYKLVCKCKHAHTFPWYILNSSVIVWVINYVQVLIPTITTSDLFPVINSSLVPSLHKSSTTHQQNWTSVATGCNQSIAMYLHRHPPHLQPLCNYCGSVLPVSMVSALSQIVIG
jgi:hypothetical protein